MIYIDTSVVLAKLFGESVKFSWNKLKDKELISCSLIYYEVISACKRENLDFKEANLILDSVNIISEHSLLEDEVQRVLSFGYLRGADLMHLAHAVFFSRNEPRNLHFLTFDKIQMKIAKELGFKTF